MFGQKELKAYLEYNCETGVFLWIINPARNVKSGDVAGTTDRKGYIRITINKKRYAAHRLAWLYVYGEWPKEDIDHINHRRNDNRFFNLREASKEENSRNQKKHITNRSGVTGVSFEKDRDYWMAYISVDGKTNHLGRHKDKFDAICARMSANNKYGYHKNHGVNLSG